MAFKTHQQAIESVLENIEGEPGERMSQLQLLVSARMLAEEVRRLQDGDESEPCVCSTDFTCMASEHDDHALAVETAVQAWRDARSNDEIRARNIPPRVWAAFDALARRGRAQRPRARRRGGAAVNSDAF